MISAESLEVGSIVIIENGEWSCFALEEFYDRESGLSAQVVLETDNAY